MTSTAWETAEQVGFASAPRPNTLQPGDVIMRLGHPAGLLAYPAETPFPTMSLPPGMLRLRVRYFRVRRVLPSEVVEGRVVPWFEQPGGAVQYAFPLERTLADFVREGFLEDVTEDIER